MRCHRTVLPLLSAVLCVAGTAQAQTCRGLFALEDGSRTLGVASQVSGAVDVQYTLARPHSFLMLAGTSNSSGSTPATFGVVAEAGRPFGGSARRALQICPLGGVGYHAGKGSAYSRFTGHVGLATGIVWQTASGVSLAPFVESQLVYDRQSWTGNAVGTGAGTVRGRAAAGLGLLIGDRLALRPAISDAFGGVGSLSGGSPDLSVTAGWRLRR